MVFLNWNLHCVNIIALCEYLAFQFSLSWWFSGKMLVWNGMLNVPITPVQNMKTALYQEKAKKYKLHANTMQKNIENYVL